MGWHGGYGVTAQQLIAESMNGCEILARSGNWIVWRNPHGHVGLVHWLTRRHGKEVMVKPVEITMGPGITPPASIARKYLSYYGGDADAAGGTYGADCLRKALESKVKVEPGSRMYLAYPEGYRFRDGTPAAGWYTYLGGYRARHETFGVVGLSKQWRKLIREVGG